MADIQISEVPVTKTAAEIDADAEYMTAEAPAGTTYKGVITEFVKAGMAQATGALAVADDISIAGQLTIDNATAGPGLQINVNSTRRVGILQNELSTGYNAQYVLVGPSYDNGSNAGPAVALGRNENAATPAGGFLRIRNKNNTSYRLWVDGSGNWRIGTSDPTNANDTSGTVVGTQTSMAAAKNIMLGLSAIDEVAARIQTGADAVRRFAYKSGAYNRQVFEAVVVDLAPDYGMDRDEDHPAGKALNEIQIIGDLLRMVADLAQRVAELEAK